MPFVRISLPTELSLETKQAISKAVHQSLIREFHIPEDDYFHVIEELEKHQICFPESYLGISHTPNIVFIQIIAGTGRTAEQKRRLYASIAQLTSTSCEILANDIIITLVENNREDWSFGLGEVQTFTHL